MTTRHNPGAGHVVLIVWILGAEFLVLLVLFGNVDWEISYLWSSTDNVFFILLPLQLVFCRRRRFKPLWALFKAMLVAIHRVRGSSNKGPAEWVLKQGTS